MSYSFQLVLAQLSIREKKTAGKSIISQISKTIQAFSQYLHEGRWDN